MGKRKEKKAAEPLRPVDVVDELNRVVDTVHGIEDAVRGGADLQGADMSGVCTLLEMLADRLRHLTERLKAGLKAA
jgi:hypothetical protein